jgi:Haem-binding domain
MKHPFAIGALVVAVLASMQLVPVRRENPPVELEMPAGAELRAVLRRACYDCHSNETRWPWYSRVAPASWMIANDVYHARKRLNFSTWNRYGQAERRDERKKADDAVEEGDMPLWLYVPLHPEADLDRRDRRLILEWARSASGS